MTAISVIDVTPAELADALDRLLTEIIAYRLRPRIERGPATVTLISAADLVVRTRRASVFLSIARDPFEGSMLLAVREIGVALFDIGGDDLMVEISGDVCARDPSNEDRRCTIVNSRWDGIGRWCALTRHRLPNRRAHEALAFTFRGIDYVAGIGRFNDGALAEVFLDCAKGSSPVADDARDAAVCLSLALQYGTPPEAIRAAVTREANGSASGIVGAVLDLLAETSP